MIACKDCEHVIKNPDVMDSCQDTLAKCKKSVKDLFNSFEGKIEKVYNYCQCINVGDCPDFKEKTK